MNLNENIVSFGANILKIISRILPLRLWLWLCRNILGLIARFRKRELDICIAQMRYANERGSGDAPFVEKNDYREMSIRVFRHLGECIGELFVIDRLFKEVAGPALAPKPPLDELPTAFEHFSSDGWLPVRDLINQGKGAVVLSGHIGCIELLAAYYTRCGVPLTVAGRLPNSSGFAGWLEKLRESYGVETMWREDPGSSRKLRNALKEGRFIAALIDQDTKLESGYAPFFGMDAAHPISPIQMAVKFKLPVFSSFIVRDGPNHHHMHTEQIHYEPKDPKAKQKILDIFSERLEQMVRQYPEQWVWWHKRWRRRPEINYEEHPEKLQGSAAYVEWVDAQRKTL